MAGARRGPHPVGAAGLPRLRLGQAGCGCAGGVAPLRAAGAFKPMPHGGFSSRHPSLRGLRREIKRPPLCWGGGSWRLVGAAGLPRLRLGQAGCGCAGGVAPLRAAGAFKPMPHGGFSSRHPSLRGLRREIKRPPRCWGGGSWRLVGGVGMPSEAAFFFDFIGISSSRGWPG